MEIIVNLFGYILIYVAVNIGRKDYSNIEFFSKENFLIITLIGVGGFIISNADIWFNIVK